MTTTPLHAPSIDPNEVAYFEKVAHRWWDTDGPFWPLHRLDTFRIGYVRERLSHAFGTDSDAERPLEGLRLLDIGCGGGILSESLARLGAQVTGGVRINPFNRSFHYTGYTGVNYMLLLQKGSV